MSVIFDSSSAMSQNISLPVSLLQYATYHQSLQLHKKLVKTCKWAFLFQRCVVVAPHWSYKTPKIMDYDSIVLKDHLQRLKELNLKIWLCNSGLFGIQINNIYRFELKKLVLGRCNLTYDEFIKITASKTIEKFYADDVVVRYRNQTIVSLDVLLAEMPLANEFYYWDPNESYFTMDTLKNLVALKRASKIKYLLLTRLQYFDFSDFLPFIEKHCEADAEFTLEFVNSFPEENHVFNFVESITRAFPTANTRDTGNGWYVRYNDIALLCS